MADEDVKTLGGLVTALLTIGMVEHNGGSPVVQFTLDGDQFYVIDTFIDYGDGSVVAQLAPWPA